MDGIVKPDGPNDSIDTYDFVFLHRTLPSYVEESLEDLAIRIFGLTGKDNLVCVTGGGDEEMQLGGRIISVLSGINTAEDFLRLPWHLVQEGFQGTAQELKQILTEARCELLVSFLLLSQGYLSTFASYDQETGKWGPPPISEALAEMGFSEEMSEEHRERINPILAESDSSENLCSAQWWLEPFGVISDGRPDAIKGSRFLASLKKEWSMRESESLPPSFRRMVLSLLRGKELVSPALVASAYLEITRRLSDL
jgi:hypothetical protein